MGKTAIDTTGWGRNILAVYGMATEQEAVEGMGWYLAAGYFCAHHGDLNTNAGIIAALSPCMPWEANKAGLLEILHERTCYRQSKANVDKALKILDGAHPLDVLGGLKVRAFYACITDIRANQVCVDRHAKSICLGRHLKDKELESSGSYYDFERAYQEACLGTPFSHAYQLQACTWLTWRRLKKEWGKAAIPFSLEGYLGSI